MKYVSTRNPTDTGISLAEAVVAGLAPDGGLYVPEEMPTIDAEALVGKDQPTVGRAVLAAFRDEASHDCGPAIEHAYQWPVKLEEIGEPTPKHGATAILELYWGPSSAFKDYGAQFLASYMPGGLEPGQRVTVMVATSGDTGGAVAAAFHRKLNVDVYVLYPDGRVSARQEHQLCCWGDNVKAIAVRGSFDDCQRLVKGAFKDDFWTRGGRFLTSANSINVGRLLPQVVYYAWSSLEYRRRHGAAPSYIVPTGNLGNALACVWARQIGFPIERIVLATNANETLADYYRTGEWGPRESIPTLANAMDVGDPSNMERLRALYPDHASFVANIHVETVTDDEIEEVIRNGESEWGRVFDPHTACAIRARERLGGAHWICAATAHPAKFETIVEPLVGHEVDLPPALAALMDRPTTKVTIEPSAEELRAASVS